MSSNRWHAIWQRRTPYPDLTSTLAQLIPLDGYNAFGGPSETNWLAYIEQIAARLPIASDASVFDVGCGSGAFLYPFYQAGRRVGGLDYSETLVNIARATMPNADLQVGEATTLNTAETFDVVVSQAMFMYLPSHDYAATVLRKMVQKATRSIGIFDVPDLATRDADLAQRRQALGDEEYARRYAGLDHQYYARDWFAQRLADMAVNVRVEDQCLRGYAHSAYRFNVFIQRR